MGAGASAAVDSLSLDLSNDDEVVRQLLYYYKEGPERFDRIVAEVHKRAAAADAVRDAAHSAVPTGFGAASHKSSHAPLRRAASPPCGQCKAERAGC